MYSQVDAANDRGRTALMGSAYAGLERVVQLLLRMGADPNRELHTYADIHLCTKYTMCVFENGCAAVVAARTLSCIHIIHVFMYIQIIHAHSHTQYIYIYIYIVENGCAAVVADRNGPEPCIARVCVCVCVCFVYICTCDKHTL